jgi:hypothetical protein
MNALPIEIQNHIWSFVGPHPLASHIKDVFNNAYLTCDDVYTDNWNLSGIPFHEWYFNMALPECRSEVRRLNAPFSKRLTTLFNVAFYNLQILQLGCDCCDGCGLYLDFIAVNHYDGMCETCYAQNHEISDDSF